MSLEARIHPRLQVEARLDAIGTEVVLGKILEDISMGGCKVRGPAWETVGVELALVIYFPRQGVNIPLQGVVARAAAQDTGIRFHKLGDDQKWALRKQLREATTR